METMPKTTRDTWNMVNRREFLAAAAASVAATQLHADSNGTCGKDTPYLGRGLHEWIDAIGDENQESSHVVEALAAYGRPALTASLQRSLHTSSAVSERRLRRLFHITASRDLGIIDDLLKTSAADSWQSRVCLDLSSPFIDRSPVVVNALQKEAIHSDLQRRCYAIELLLDAGIPVPLASIEPAVLEYEAHHQSGDRSDDSYYRAYSLDLMRILLRTESSEPLKAALFERVARLRGRLDDNDTSFFVPYLSQCGEWGQQRLIDYAVSNLKETSRSACEWLSAMAAQDYSIVRSLAMSAERDRRIAAFRILGYCSEVPAELLDLARQNLDHRDPGVCGLAALALVKHRVDQDRAETALTATIRRPELRYRRWIMEGLEGFAGPVNPVDCRLARWLNDDDEDVRYYAMRRVRQLRIDSPEIIRQVGEIWQGRTKAGGLQRTEAFEYLVEIGEAAIPIALNALNGRSPRAHHEAIILFGRLGSRAIVVAPELAACWRFDDSLTRGEILQSLYSMKAYLQLWPLVVEALNGDDPELFCIAAAMLPGASRSDFVRLWPFAKKGLRDRDCEIQNAAAFAVSNHGVEAIADLLCLLRSDDPYARLGATKGLRLCRIDSQRVREAIRQAAGDQDVAVRLAASAPLSNFVRITGRCILDCD